MKASDLKTRQAAPLLTPTDLGPAATLPVAAALNVCLPTRLRYTSKPRTSTGTCPVRTFAIIICCWMSRANRSSP